MAIEPGCQFGLASVGGKPRQCKDPIEREATVLASDRGQKEQLPLCSLHLTQMEIRKVGTVYREVNGVATPVKIAWAERAKA